MVTARNCDVAVKKEAIWEMTTIDQSNKNTLYSKPRHLHLESTICSSALHIASLFVILKNTMCKDEEHIVPSQFVSTVNRLVQLLSHDISSCKRSRQFLQALRGWDHLIISILPGGEPDMLLVNDQVCLYRALSGIHR